MRALLVEDHLVLSSQIQKYLRVGGFEVDGFQTLADAQEATRLASYDIILLDRQLPDGDGLDWLRTFRAEGHMTPVIVTTAARRDLNDRVEGLNLGADDYIIKPIEFEELIARVRAVLRRPHQVVSSSITIGDVEFDPATREVTIAGSLAMLPRREMCLLETLMRRPGRIFPRASLEENLYGYDGEVTPNAIEVSVHRLRRALKKHGSTVKVHTVRGIGYMLAPDTENRAAAKSLARSPGIIESRAV